LRAKRKSVTVVREKEKKRFELLSKGKGKRGRRGLTARAISLLMIGLWFGRHQGEPQPRRVRSYV
jgi:hypothetical protein